MRKAIRIALFSISSLAIIYILQGFFPKYQAMLILLLVFLLMDIYLWRSVKGFIYSRSMAVRYMAASIYWLPLIVLAVLVIFGLFYSFLQWNLFIRTQVVSLVFITFVAQAISMLILIIADLDRLVRGFLRKLKGVRPAFAIGRRGKILVGGWILGALVWSILLLGMVVWIFDFKVRTVEVPMASLPKAFNGYRVVQISDIHLGSWTPKSKLIEAVSLINSLKPDVILFTGDMFNYATDDGNGFQQILSQLKSRHGVYCILGNHDYGDYVRWPDAYAKQQNMKKLHSWYETLGWHLLANESARIAEGSDTIAIIGVENWGAEKRFQKRADMTKALTGVTGIPCKILLSHDPTHWDSVISQQYPCIGLTLSGHTHGGQFGIETESVHWSPIEWLYPHWGGLYTTSSNRDLPKQFLYVNRGLGTVGYSGRVGIRPEITLLILKNP
jgi:predicted MPP superfamily phosphohydrolase